jgi:V/A-type H+-transporting ATPase subunit D
MDENVLPTKKNLIFARQNLKFATKGHNLLELKLTVLLRELKHAEKTASEIQEKLQSLYLSAEILRGVAEIEIGEKIVAEVLTKARERAERDYISPPPNPKSRQGNTNANPSKISIPYKLNETCAALDEAFFAWIQIFLEEGKLAAVLEIISALKIRVAYTKKRASALGNIVIPAQEKRVKFISERLEENERDELVRLKAAR